MNRLAKSAILTKLMENLRENRSWCGETHVQKATFFLTDLMRVPLGYEFILYKHGPYSFDLRNELTSMRADGLIRLEPQGRYGPRIVLTRRCSHLQEHYPRTLKKFEEHIDFVASEVGPYEITMLERIATALFVTLRGMTGASVDGRVSRINRLKPHIPTEMARTAVEDVDRIVEEAGSRIEGVCHPGQT